MLKSSKILSSDPLNEQLDQAILAYHAKTLERRVVISGSIQTLSSDETMAKEQIKTLLTQGYELAKNEAGFCYLTQGLPGGSPLSNLIKKLDTKPTNQRSVFITYNWDQQEIARALQVAFEDKGFLVIRDEDHLPFNTYLPDFMKIINHRNLDYVLPIISDTYLKSMNCMYEVDQIMKRYEWEKSLLPYVVTRDPQANANIYSNVDRYMTYWREEYDKAQIFAEKEKIKNIQKNIPDFIKAITTRINIPESQLIETEYQAFFDMIGEMEKEKESLKLKEIEELLRVASTNEKLKKHEKVKQSLETAIQKLEAIEHLDGIDAIFAKVYGFYAEYLLKQNKEDAKGKEYLEIAINFGFTQLRTETPQQVVQTNNNNAFSSSSSSNPSGLPVTTFPQAGSPAASAHLVQRPLTVEPELVKQFLKYVVDGEQDKAEAMLKQNKALALATNDVTDLSGRSFQGITGFQYAIWALDWHMWNMIRKYLSDEHAAQQLESSQNGSWVGQHGIHANWNNLITALRSCIDLYTQSKLNEGNQVWAQQVGGAQLLLPAHVVNEYCHPTRSFNPCPNYTALDPLPRSRKVQVFEPSSGWRDIDDWFAARSLPSFNPPQNLGKTFAFFRNNASQAGGGWGWTGHGYLGVGKDTSDLASVTSLYQVRVRQRDELIQELKSKNNIALQSITKTTPQLVINVNLTEVKKFLKHVVDGEQDQAEAMLKQNKDLVLVANDVTDLSGRTFQGITGFQYAIWALDRHMWTMIEKYLDKDSIRTQLQGMENGGWVNHHGRSANWQLLIGALDKQIELLNAKNWDAARQWQKGVGGAERQLPAHVVNEYCHPNRSFNPCPDFATNAPLPRARQLQEGDWFTASYNGGSLGETFAIYRGATAGKPAINFPDVSYFHSTDWPTWRRGDLAMDRAACHSLLEIRMREREALFQRYQVSMTSTLPLTFSSAAQLIATTPTPFVSSADLQKFLTHVVFGEQAEAEAMLKANKSLALTPGDITDCANRTFKNITALQYAVWALDWHMWTMLREYIPAEALKEQLQGLKNGVWVSQHGESASWKALVDAQQKAIALYGNWPAVEQIWTKEVGGAQRNLPMHVINEYCHSTRKFYPCPDFTGELPRSRRVEEYRDGKWVETDWFSATLAQGKLGETFGFVRGSYDKAVGKNNGFDGRQGLTVAAADCRKYDRQACETLFRVRLQQRDQLLTEVLKDRAGSQYK